MRCSKAALPVMGLMMTGTALAQPSGPIHPNQEFSTHLLSAQSHNHLLGEFATGSEDNVDVDSLRLAGEFDVALLRVANTPVELSLIGQYQSTEVEADAPPGFAGSARAELDTLNFGAKGAWTVPAEPKLQIGTGAYVSTADFEAGGADDSETGVVGFGSVRYTITSRFDTYGTVLVSTEDRVQDTGVVAGVLYDIGSVAFGGEIATPDDTTVTPFLTWSASPNLRLNAGLTTGGEPDPVFRGQLAWVFETR